MAASTFVYVMAASTTYAKRAMLIALAVGLSLAACSSSGDASAAEPTPDTAPRSTEAPTTTAANRPPQLRMVPSARSEIDVRYSDAIIASDPDGDEVVVRVGSGPLGFSPIVNSRGAVTGFEWRPTEPGTWDVDVTATDVAGASSVTTLRLIGRAPRPTSLVLAMGDSIAAGHGRDRSDFLGTDECFRSERDAYATLTTDALIEAGSLADDAGVLVVACAETTVHALSTDVIHATNSSGDRLTEERTQMGWASSLNPTIITLTVGGESGGFFGVESLLIPEIEGREEVGLDEAALAQTHRDLTHDLTSVLAALLDTTDAHIVITTYYDPTAADPIGVEGCAAECFGAAMNLMVGGLNDAILGAVDLVSSQRVSVARLDGPGDVWEASNGVGPDFVRDGLGPLQGLVDRFTGGSSGTCADDGDPPEDLVSALDCLHPNEAGHRAIADRVTDVLLSI